MGQLRKPSKVREIKDDLRCAFNYQTSIHEIRFHVSSHRWMLRKRYIHDDCLR